MDGILLVDKPSGWTSFDVVARVRSILRSQESSRLYADRNTPKIHNTDHKLQTTSSSAKPKVGHTGTLDPLATGLLVLLLGNYTKSAQEFTKLDKTYEVKMRLGQTSTTGDEEGEKTNVSNNHPPLKQVQAVLKKFEGEINQIPPAFSAIKINGQRAYKLARTGKKPELKSRPVHIYFIEFKKYAYPFVEFTTHASSGTYIRSLAEDIGTALGTGAYLTALRRISVGQFEIKDAISLEKVLDKTTLRSYTFR